MQSSIIQLVVGLAVAIGMALVGVSAIGNAAARTSTIERTPIYTPGPAPAGLVR